LDVVRLLLQVPRIDVNIVEDRAVFLFSFLQTFVHSAMTFEVVELLLFIFDNPEIDLNQSDRHGVCFILFLQFFILRYKQRMKNCGDDCLNEMMLNQQLHEPLEFIFFLIGHFFTLLVIIAFASVVQLLLNKDQVDVNAVNLDWNTPLHFATEQRSLEIVKMLLPRPESKLGQINRCLFTPLDQAIRLNHVEIAEVLKNTR
jgi:hypothetical protein